MNWLALIILVVAFVLWLVYLYNHDKLQKVALQAILEAEKAFRSGKGKEKMEYAVCYVYELLPSYTRFILPKDFLYTLLEHFIQKLFDEVKKLLDYKDNIVVINEGGKK